MPKHRFIDQLASVLTRLESQYPMLNAKLPQLIGVSGGRDSVALLCGLHELGWRYLEVIHLNHELRAAESEMDSVWVEQLATRLGYRYWGFRRNVADLAQQRGISIELAARLERQYCFQEVAKKIACEQVFLAHHLEDQAETVLINLARGAATKGVGGMREYQTMEGLSKVRPLLTISRKDLESYLQFRQQKFREDSSNAQACYTRNRVRLELLPLMSQIFQRDVIPNLTRYAQLSQYDEAFLDQHAQQMWQTCVIGEGNTLCYSSALQTAPIAIATRVLQIWLRQIGELRGVGYQELMAIYHLLQKDHPARCNLSEGRQVRRRQRQLSVVLQ